MNLGHSILLTFGSASLAMLVVFVLPTTVQAIRKQRLIARFADWFVRDGLPCILLFLGACATGLFFWILDAAGYNNVLR